MKGNDLDSSALGNHSAGRIPESSGTAGRRPGDRCADYRRGPAHAAEAPPKPDPRFAFTRNAQYSVKEAPNSYQDITHYNNFYEFGTGKEDPAQNAHSLRPRPWSVTVGGECALRGTFRLDDLIKGLPLEERVYRFRCVEAWSMVIPWLGFQLSGLIQKSKPNSNAKYVQFITLMDPKQMPGESDDVLQWPYVEGLRMDEAMNPLTLLAIGLYGSVLPNQDGAPLRLVIPGNTGSRASNPSSKSTSSPRSRAPPGTSRRPMNTASTPM